MYQTHLITTIDVLSRCDYPHFTNNTQGVRANFPSVSQGVEMMLKVMVTGRVCTMMKGFCICYISRVIP